jgi:Uroporphyrinogen-III decarboxylase
MNKKERIRAAVTGEKPDCLPYSFWSHLPAVDLDPVLLADETYKFYKTYDVDFIKTMNNGMYAIEDYGCVIDFSEIEKGGVAKVVSTPVQCADDWGNLAVCPLDKGSLARELTSLKLLLAKVKQENVPVLFTVFSPITIADKLSGKQMLAHIAAGHGAAVHKALRAITETTANLAQEAIRLGADGIFFASQLSTYDAMQASDYLEYGKPYDLVVMEAASAGWFNTLHAHGNNIMLEVLRDYPVAVFNWHAGETLPALNEARALVRKCLMGGLQRMDITNKKKNEVQHQIFECIRMLGGRNHILTPGCVIRYPLDNEMLAFVKRSKEYVEACCG